MNKIKLLYGLEAAGGGALKHLVYLATRLDKETFDLHIILSGSRKENITREIKQLKDAGAKVSLFSMPRNINPFKDFTVLLKLISSIDKEKYDIIHAHSSKAGGLFRLAAWMCRVHVICYTPHCFYFQGKNGLKRMIFVLLEQFLSKITTKIIVSENEQAEIIKYKIAKVSKTVNINNAIDFDEYQQTKEVTGTKENLKIPVNAFVVGSIGRLTFQKDWETYIYSANEVLKTHPETVFLIVGDGELYSEIQKLIFKLNLENKVILTGYIQDIHKIYGIIDVFVNTSLWEGLPYVFLEAMKYKKPIIATNIGSEATVIHEESGFISPVKDYHAIAEKINLLVENKQMAINMGKKGMERLTEKYSFERFIQQHEELYKKLFLEYKNT